MNIFSKRKGQTIIEAMLAIGLLTTGFLGIVTLLSRSIFLTRVTSDETTATYLASEGIEIAKNLIDHDVFSGKPWDSCFGAGGDFQFDYSQTTCPPPLYNASTRLTYDPNTHLYGYGGPVTTNFVRRVRVTLSGVNQIVVQSTVSWSTGPLTTQTITLEDHFYDWRP